MSSFRRALGNICYKQLTLLTSKEWQVNTDNDRQSLVDKVINCVLNPIQSIAMLENGALGRFVLRLATEVPKAGPGNLT